MLICRSLTRLARNISKQFRVEHILNKLGVRIEYYKYKFADTAEGRFQKNIFASLAEYERENISFRTHYGKRKKVKSGKVYVNGVAPYGYIEHNVTIGDDIVERTLKVVPEEAEVVQEIFEMFTSDKSVSAASIARHLTAQGIAPPGNTRYVGEQYKLPADAAWYGQTVRKLLNRKTYTGIWEYGKKGKDETIPVQVEPIVNNLVWESAQAKLETTKRTRAIVDNYPYLLRNIAFCGVCGMPMRCKSDHRRQENKRYYSYACSKSYSQYGAERCDHTLSYRADIVDNHMWHDIKPIFTDPTALQEAYKHYLSSLATQDNPIEAKLKAKQKLIRKKKLALDRLLDEYLEGRLSKKRYHTHSNKLEAAMNTCKAEATALQADLDAASELELQQQDVEQYINEMPDLLAKTDANDRLKMEILETLGVGVYMYPEGEYKNVNWALFGESFRPSGMPSSPLVRFTRKHHLSLE